MKDFIVPYLHGSREADRASCRKGGLARARQEKADAAFRKAAERWRKERQGREGQS